MEGITFKTCSGQDSYTKDKGENTTNKYPESGKKVLENYWEHGRTNTSKFPFPSSKHLCIGVFQIF